MDYISENNVSDYVLKNKLENGKHTILVNGKKINVEVVRYEGDYTQNASSVIGDSVPDTHMLILIVEGKLTVSSGATLTPRVRKKGFFVFARKGIVNNGTISMSYRGAIAEGDDLVLVLDKSNKTHMLSKTGGNGASGVSTTTNEYGTTGNKGGTTTFISCGGGGSGGIYKGLNKTYSVTSGSGAGGTTYSGGAGSGGASVRDRATGVGNVSSNATGNGGKGSNGFAYRYDSGEAFSAGGGAGNPGGSYGQDGTSYLDTNTAQYGGTGTGGLLILCGKYIENKGAITSYGASGGGTSGDRGAGGGGAGGGAIVLIYDDSISKGTVSAAGGSGGYGYAFGYTTTGGAGGNGSITEINAKIPIRGYLFKKGQNLHIIQSETLIKIDKEGSINFNELDLMYASVQLNNLLKQVIIKTDKSFIEVDRKPLSIKFD